MQKDNVFSYITAVLDMSNIKKNAQKKEGKNRRRARVVESFTIGKGSDSLMSFAAEIVNSMPQKAGNTQSQVSEYQMLEECIPM